MQLWSKLKVWREVWRSKGEFFSMNIKELIDEWYSFRPLPPLEETGFLELPLKLEDLPKAIQTLKIYEPYAEMEKYKNVSDLRRRIGDFITGNLMATGWEGAAFSSSPAASVTWNYSGRKGKRCLHSKRRSRISKQAGLRTAGKNWNNMELSKSFQMLLNCGKEPLNNISQGFGPVNHHS